MPFDMIFTYTRQNAIDDGVLIDVTETAKEVGFRVPVAVTDTVWHGYIVPTENDRKKEGQSESGRLWDVLSNLMMFIRFNRDCTDHLIYPVSFVMNGVSKTVNLKAMIHGGDHGEPVLTIMMIDED